MPFFTLPREQQFFNFAALTPALPAVDREYLYGSLDRKICDNIGVFCRLQICAHFLDAPGAGSIYT